MKNIPGMKFSLQPETERFNRIKEDWMEE